MTANTTITPVRHSDLGEDGHPIDKRRNERAGILSTIMFLERLVRTSSVAEADRKEARFQADYLRSLVRSRVRDGRETLDGQLREALAKLMAPPPVTIETGPLTLENGS